jgi:alanine racemase
MGFTPEPLLRDALHYQLTQTVFSLPCAFALAATAARLNKRAAVHIKIDTGMSRLGFLPTSETIRAICELKNHPNLDIQGIYTHCATSDMLDNHFMFEQHARFIWVLNELEKCGIKGLRKHMANSGVIAQTLRQEPQKFHTQIPRGGDPSFCMDFARVGILLYGLPPSFEMAEICKSLALKPVMRLMTQVSSIKKIDADVGVSYGHLYKTKRESIIAVLPIGYADGYPRRLSRGGHVLIRGRLAPIAGAICMDQLMVDVTDIPDVTHGDAVTLLGDSISADCLAEQVGTISYEIICGIGKRVPRVYINGNKR